MSNKTIIIDQNLNSVIQVESFNQFTIMQLRDAYLAELDSETSRVEARKFVYRQVLRFLKSGLLKKEKASNAREIKYHKTTKFFKSKFKARSTKNISRKDIYPIKAGIGLEQIREQLNQYKVDLLASVGESEEYMRLYKSNPELKVLLKTEYHHARDQSSRLLGQIKALKTVLTHYSS
jgi:hypothetical protein